jgi:hypothetical protein
VSPTGGELEGLVEVGVGGEFEGGEEGPLGGEVDGGFGVKEFGEAAAEGGGIGKKFGCGWERDTRPIA